MSKETLLPWTIDEYFNEITIRDNNKDFVLNMRLTIDAKKKRNNAQLILQAVNNHDRLVERLEDVINALKDDISILSPRSLNAFLFAKQLLTELKQQ